MEMWYKRLLISGTLTIWYLSVFFSPAAAQTQHYDFVYRNWNNQSGLPQNSVYDLAFDAGGYLWGVTEEGIFRFDGAEFKLFNESNTPGLSSSTFYDLEPSPSGLWASSRNAVLLVDRKVRNITDMSAYLEGGWIKCMKEDRAGRLWIGTSGGAIYFLEKEKITLFSAWKKDNGSIEVMLPVPQGMMVGTSRGLYLVPGGSRSPVADTLFRNTPVTALAEGPHNTLWVGTGNKGLFRTGGNAWHFTEQNGLKEGYINSLRTDSSGKLWIGFRSAGYQVLEDGQFITPVQSHYAHDGVRSFLFGNNMVWIGTNSTGLIQLKPREIGVLDNRHPVSSSIILPVYQHSGGDVWVGTAGKGAYRIHGQEVTALNKENGLSNNLVFSFAGAGDDMFIGTSNGLDRFNTRTNRFTKHYNEKDGLMSTGILGLLPDTKKRLWIATRNGGMHRLYPDGRLDTVVFPASVGNSNIIGMHESSQGNVWLGTRGSGMIRIGPGEKIVHFHRKQAFPADIVYSFYEDPSGEIWMATEKGLIAFNNGKFAVMNKKAGLVFNEIYRILADPAGYLWMSGNHGLQRVALAHLKRAVSQEPSMRRLQVKLFNAFDGMENAETNGGFYPAGWAMKDGTLWFPTAHGIAIADHRLVKNRFSPVGIRLQSLQYGDNEFLPDEKISIPPGVYNMEIRYTSIDFSKSADISYQYRLIGLSNDWVSVGNRRRAYFSALPPGEYIFQVKAEQYGNWSPLTQFSFTVRPYFYQSLWFRFLLLFLLAGSVWLYIWLQKRKARRIYRQQLSITKAQVNAQEKERQVIGAELHDNINQQLTTAKVYLNFARDDEKLRLELVKKSEDVVQKVINDLRDLSRTLTPPSLRDIGLEEAIEELLLSYKPAARLETELVYSNEGAELQEDLQFALYRITQEQLTNIIKHAEAHKVEVELNANPRLVSLRIKDDGVGFDPTRTNLEKGMGLRNIRNRLALYNGFMEIRAQPGKGCTLMVTIPLEGSEEGGA